MGQPPPWSRLPGHHSPLIINSTRRGGGRGTVRRNTPRILYMITVQYTLFTCHPPERETARESDRDRQRQRERERAGAGAVASAGDLLARAWATAARGSKAHALYEYDVLYVQYSHNTRRPREFGPVACSGSLGTAARPRRRERPRARRPGMPPTPKRLTCCCSVVVRRVCLQCTVLSSVWRYDMSVGRDAS